MPALYLSTGKTAGDEVSSTYEGRHVTLEESYLTHPYHVADGFVDKGDPVLINTGQQAIVGVAFKSAVAATDYIALDTEGIWFLYVHGVITDGTLEGMAHVLVAGDPVYIKKVPGTGAGSTTILSGQNDPAKYIAFGTLLGTVAASLESANTPTLVAVKVHNDFGFENHQIGQYYGVFDEEMLIDMTVSVAGGQNNPGWMRAFLGAANAIAATKTLYGLSIRLTNEVVASAGYLVGGEIKVVQNAAAGTLAELKALKVQIDNPVSGVTTMARVFHIQATGAGTAPAVRTAIDFESSGTAGTRESLFHFHAATDFGMLGPFTTPAAGNAIDIPIDVNGTYYHINAYVTVGHN